MDQKYAAGWVFNQGVLYFRTHVAFLIRWTQLNILLFLGYSNLRRTVNLPNHEAQQQLQQIQQKIGALPKSRKPLPPVMQPSAFLTALAHPDTANPDILQDFLHATQVRSLDNLPKPVPIGTHDGIPYFIKFSDKAIHHTAVIPPAREGEVFYGISTYEAKSVLGGQSTTTDLDYGSPANSGDDFYGIPASEAKSVPVGQTITTDQCSPYGGYWLLRNMQRCR